MRTKAALREKYKQKRQQLSLGEIEQKSIAIANQVLKLDIWQHTYYHLFLSIKQQKEVDTDLLLHVLQGKHKQLVVSQSNFKDHSLKHFLLTDSTPIKLNKFNIPEPQDGLEVPVEKIDVVFVPLLAFDKNGNRVGYGKGFYDRFLKNCREDVVKIGLSFFEPEQNIKVDKHDHSLNYGITPAQIFKF
jgi:5-formyltetrahydrofolate cyclo-ligase